MRFPLLLAILVLFSCLCSTTSAEKKIEKITLETIKPITLTEVETNGYASTNEKGEELCEGDIVCDKKTKEGGSDRNAINGEQHRWPKENGIVVVPYVFDSSLSDKAKTQVLAAAADYAAWTCIKFVERTDQNDYINMTKLKGCWSRLGRQGGKQDLSLGTGCDLSKGTPAHEMMHAMGFHHEQTRNDRDQHVTVRLDLVTEGKQHNFDICTVCTDPEGMPYDYRSVMHYGATDFSTTGEPVIIPKDGDVTQLGQRSGLCTGDIKRLNQMYKCGGVTASPTKPNDGVVPCDVKTDRLANCADYLDRCSDPGYDFFAMCAKTCQGKEKGGLYDRYPLCHEYANYEGDQCKTHEQIKEHCTLSCSKL